MRFKWEFWDFVKEYLLKVILLWFVIFSAFSGLAYLFTEFGFGKDIPREDWITIWITIVVLGIFFAQIVVYYRVASPLKKSFPLSLSSRTGGLGSEVTM